MPTCFCPEELGGATYFEEVTAELSDWMPTHEHFPVSKQEGGREAVDNAILAHRLCNRIDYSIRVGVHTREISNGSEGPARRQSPGTGRNATTDAAAPRQDRERHAAPAAGPSWTNSSGRHRHVVAVARIDERHPRRSPRWRPLGVGWCDPRTRSPPTSLRTPTTTVRVRVRIVLRHGRRVRRTPGRLRFRPQRSR
jgi:hypothetical protein